MSYDGIFDNHLYDRDFFDHEIFLTLPEIEDPEAVFDRLAAIRRGVVAGDAEAGLDINFTYSLLQELGWPCAYQQNFRFHTLKKKPDFLLFASEEERLEFLAAPKNAKPLGKIVSVWEDKAEDVPLDNGRLDVGNPYFQLMEYLLQLHLPYGFLGNGHEIRFMDNSAASSDKRYLAVDFDRLVETRNIGALRIFLAIFSHAGHYPAAGREAPARAVAKESERREIQSEAELRNVIYGLDGRESLFEKCGAFLFNAQKIRDQSILAELYKNCLYFTFRLIFIALVEDRHREILLKHPGYRSISLAYLYQQAKELVKSGNANGYEAWDGLQSLFRTLDQGNPNLDIPLFNGGLFARHIARMLDQPKVMTNAGILELLDMLYGKRGSEEVRDFSSLSVIHLGRIYESLLEFEFRIAEENMRYFTYRQKKNGKFEIIDGYFDSEDYENIARSKKCEILGPVIEYKKGEVYLVGGRNSRKQSASYYTPESLSKPLVRAALDDAVAKLGGNGSLLDLKILDNACGSGHMLVECLKYLTDMAILRIGTDARLKSVLEDEKKRVSESLEELGLAKLGIKADDMAILRRILLKRIIYGVDLQPFAIELTKLSLWIETFIFGTPLSFIEHHIKAGNALIGCPLARVEKALGASGQQNLMDQTITDSFRELSGIFRKLIELQDTTAADITASKNIYATEISPPLEEMGSYFDLLNSADMLLAESLADAKMAADPPPIGAGPDKDWREAYRKSSADKKSASQSILSQYGMLAQELRYRMRNWQKTEEAIVALRQKYGFFNWHLEFPEVFADPETRGFDVIIGNPPWDKTKFSDPDFFSQYRSNYRQMSNSEKRRAATELLAKPFILSRYENQENGILSTNEYYKAQFPQSQGEGDGNLFRFFVERNLGLLRKGGTLNYVIPTALWTDEGSTRLRTQIFARFWLRYYYGFENRKGLFPEVHLCYKFGLMQIEKPAEPAPAHERKANARFMLTSPAELADPGASFTYTLDDVSVTSPRWHALMEVRSRRELDIMRKIHSGGYPYLDPGWLDFRNELHATGDKKIFHEHYAEGMIPLYKGACIWQFDSQYWHRAGDENRNEYWLDVEEFDRHLQSKERGRIIDDLFSQLPAPGKKSKKRVVLDALGLKKEEELDQFIVPDRLFPRLAFRAIASDTNERTMIASVIPAGAGAQNSLWVSVPKRYMLDGKSVAAEPQEIMPLFFAQAFFNSIVFDWVMRGSIAMNVNKTYIWRMPMPQPKARAIEGNPAFLRLAQNSLRLSAFYNKTFEELFPQFGLDESARITAPKMAAMARRDNDLIVSRLYGLDKADMEALLSSFTVMNRNQPGYGAKLLEMIEE